MTPRGRDPSRKRSAVAPTAAPDLEALRRFLRSLGVDPVRDPEYAETVENVGEFLAERTAGLRGEPQALRVLRYEGREGETIALERIPIYGLCPHHLVPWFGTVTVRFAPGSRIAGVGSLARFIRDLARVPRLQENLTQAIADRLDESLSPHGLEVAIRARHLCMEMRGAEQKAEFVTETRRGRALPPRTDVPPEGATPRG